MFARIREHLKGWKTIAANVLLGLPAAMYGAYLSVSAADFTPLIPAQYVAWFTAGWSLLGIVLRIITTGPVGSKGDDIPAPDAKAGD